jgi:sugar (pentulose or hexulose) kinase
VEELIVNNQETAGIFIPDKEKADVYEGKFEIYQRLYPVLKEFWE